MSIAQFFRILWARRWIILATTLTCFIAAVLVARSFPPRYQASSRVMLNLFKPDPVTGEAISSGFTRAYVKTQGELIRDYRIAGKVVDDLGWTTDPSLQAAYERRDPTDTRDFRRWLAQRITDNTSTGLVDASNILEIQFVSTSPEQAARIADTVRQAYVDQALSFRRDDAANNADWFRKQAGRIRTELTAAEARKTAFERANGIVLADNDTDTDTARLTALASTSPAPAAAQVAAAAQATVSPQLEQANAAIANAEKVLGPNNPELLAMKRQREALMSTAAAAQRSVAPSVAAAGPSMTSLYSAQQAKVLAQRGKVAEAQQLSADVRVLRDQYAKTSARAAELQQQGQSDETGLELLGSAVVPTSAEFPKWPLVIFGSLGLGFALGLLVSLVVELLGRRVRGAEDLGFRDVPLLGVMGKTKKARGGNFLTRWMPFRRTATQGDFKAMDTATLSPEPATFARDAVDNGPRFQLSTGLHLLSDPAGVRAESIRVLRTHLIAQHLRDGRRSLAVCAPAAGTGCSYVAANLAVGLAQTGVKTLLIDGNMRAPGLQDYFRPTAATPGLYDCLSRDDLAVRSAIHEDVVPGLSLLFAGQAAPEAQELLGGAGFKALVDACVRDYDLTVIDTPPANTFADARRIASVMRYAMVVAQRDKSYVRDVRTLIEELTADRVRVVGTYLNDI